MQEQEKVFLSRHNKIWESVKTGETYGDKLTLKKGESLTDYRQIPKPKNNSVEPSKEPRSKKQDYFRTEKNNESEGVF